MLRIELFRQIADLVEKRLPPAQAERVARRLAADRDAQQAHDWLQTFYAACTEVQLPTPSAAVSERLLALHARRFATRQEAAPSLLKRLSASLAFDSWANLAPGERAAAGDEASRQLAFSSERLDVVLDIRQEAHNATINGQLLQGAAELEGRFVVQLIVDDESAALTRSDEIGQFTLQLPQITRCSLVVSGDDFEVWLPQWHVGAVGT